MNTTKLRERLILAPYLTSSIITYAYLMQSQLYLINLTLSSMEIATLVVNLDDSYLNI